MRESGNRCFQTGGAFAIGDQKAQEHANGSGPLLRRTGSERIKLQHVLAAVPLAGFEVITEARNSKLDVNDAVWI